MSQRIPFQWGTANFKWNENPFSNQSSNPFIWNDVALIVEIAQQILTGGYDVRDIFNKYKKNKKLVRLICQINNETYDETKEIKDIQTFVTGIEILAKDMLNIDLKVKV